MFSFKEVLVFLWCVTLSQASCSNATICVASGKGSEAECQQRHIIHRLSDLTINETSCKYVNIYLTSGAHILTKNLYFSDSVVETAIHGAPYVPPSIVECENAGIRFSENRYSFSKVFLSNVVLQHCHLTRNAQNSTFQAALYLKYALYELNSVTVMDTEGYGLCAYQCYEQVIVNCTFTNSTEGHILFVLKDDHAKNFNVVPIKISETKIHDGNASGIGLLIFDMVDCNFSIVNCKFYRNKGDNLLVESYSTGAVTIRIEKSTLNTSSGNGAYIYSDVAGSKMMVISLNSNFSNNEEAGLAIIDITSAEITGCIFANNNNDGIWIGRDTVHTKFRIRECSIKNNARIGLSIDYYSSSEINMSMQTEIFKINFHNNSRALVVFFPEGDFDHETKISECSFTKHRINTTSTLKGVVNIGRYATNPTQAVILENSSFTGNQGFYGDCSALSVMNVELIIDTVSITDNKCTGITLSASTINIENTINLTRNNGLLGGALALRSGGNSLIFITSSKLNIINNTADTIGGGIYSEETCESGSVNGCFFRYDEEYETTEVFAFSGNSAKEGGDIIFGGCLSNCWFHIFSNGVLSIHDINKTDPNNTFWDLVSTNNSQSSSTFVEDPKSVIFCINTTSAHFGANNNMPYATCHDSWHHVNAYRGQIFTVPLMVTDGFCFPSIKLIEAIVFQESEREPKLQLEHGVLQKAKKFCCNFSYALRGGLDQRTATIGFKIPLQFLPPVILTVNLKDCPTGYKINSKGQCGCLDVLKSYNIECNSSHYSLKIPAQTWLGELRDGSGSIAVQKDCQYCSNEFEGTRITNITQDSDKLCVANRHGILCGACNSNQSLQLGGYECADCSDSTHKGVLLLIAFAIIGIALVLLLLGLNLTVSTGMINGLIFYSNIVYLNSDALLPITREGNSTHLQKTVKFLSIFQAWMNLDFGIVTCFFDGYDTYISTWMQFVFPLYIWLLILIIVLASRYSSRISKITTSNTVSVLATLLLLAFAKLLKTSIESFSSVELKLLDGNVSSRVWKPDANILYLSRLHIPLFLMSLAIVIVYVIPFTLLILLGPLLQAKSHYRLLNWINKLKPFLDAFYGPYASRYRYWPGILLLVRLVILVTFAFAFYSPNDTPYKLTMVSVMEAVLLATWMIIGKTRAVSLHRKRYLNYLELFFHLNLEIFTITSIYYATESTEHQQGLAVAMVGSVLAVSCGILAYQIFCTASRYKVMRKSIRFIATRMKRKEKDRPAGSTQESEGVSIKTTHSLVEMAECATPNNELREPLLTNS